MRGVVGRSPLSILYLTAPGRAGGLETVVHTLASGFKDRGHQVTVAAALDGDEPGHPFLDPLRAAGITVIPLNGGYAAERNAVKALAREVGAGVVHSHGSRCDVQLRLAPPRGVSMVTTVHGFTGGRARSRFYEWLQLRAIRGFDAVIAVSKPLGKQLEASGVAPGIIEVVPNASAPPGAPLSRAAARERLTPGVSGSLIGWAGRLGAEKGCDVFLRALAGMRDDAWTACVIGSGPEEAALRTLSRDLGLEERVIWAGLIPGAATLFPAFDLFALSSRTEGTPMVVLEAMNAGVPVVATSVGGVPDLISAPSSGWLVEPEHPAALGAALAEALRNPAEAARRAAVAQHNAGTVHSVGPWLDRHEAIYRRLLAR